MAKRATKEIKSIRDLTPDNANANRHSQRGMGMMETSITECGFGDSLTVDRNGNVISGNGRLETLAAIDMAEAIVVQSDGTKPIVHQRTDLDLKRDAKAKRLAILQNRVGETNLDWDAEVLAQMAADGVVLDDLWSTDELSALLGDALQPEAGSGGDEFDTTPDEAQTRVQYGDLWACGRHRVLCGDSTKAEDVARLMGGEKATILICDPPYGMDLDTDYAKRPLSERAAAKHPKQRNYDAVIGDDRDFDPTLYLDAFRDVPEQFWWGADYYRAFLPDGGSWLVWDKRAGIEDVEYTNAEFELCWSKKSHHRKIYRVRWFGLCGTETQDVRNRIHPTQKPLEVYAPIIEKHCKSHGIVVDPFLGSGTTLIASERTNRKCYGIEISPKYVNVILSRYEAETGQTAELLERAS